MQVGSPMVAMSPCELDSGEKSWEFMGIPWENAPFILCLRQT